jgi:hypothetical protein
VIRLRNQFQEVVANFTAQQSFFNFWNFVSLRKKCLQDVKHSHVSDIIPWPCLHNQEQMLDQRRRAIFEALRCLGDLVQDTQRSQPLDSKRFLLFVIVRLRNQRIERVLVNAFYQSLSQISQDLRDLWTQLLVRLSLKTDLVVVVLYFLGLRGCSTQLGYHFFKQSSRSDPNFFV